MSDNKPFITPLDKAPSVPLPLYASEELGTMQLPSGEVLSVQFGLSRELAEDLKRHALNEEDTDLAAHTGDRKRFGEGSYEKWYEKERYPFALVSKEGSLAAVVWFGPESFPGVPEGNWSTVAVRAYPPFRGKGIMTPFARFALQTYQRLFPVERVWLETDTDNEAAQRLAQKLGFVSAGLHEAAGRTLMILPE